jgi:hypothetical protein
MRLRCPLQRWRLERPVKLDCGLRVSRLNDAYLLGADLFETHRLDQQVGKVPHVGFVIEIGDDENN